MFDKPGLAFPALGVGAFVSTISTFDVSAIIITAFSTPPRAALAASATVFPTPISYSPEFKSKT